MNSFQKQRISELRGKGETYAAIAAELDISESTIKTYCRRNGIQPDACPVCGNTLMHTPNKKKKRFCSDKCRSTWWAKNPEAMNCKAVYNFVCLSCAKPFSAYGNAKRKYCSVSCARGAGRG